MKLPKILRTEKSLTQAISDLFLQRHILWQFTKRDIQLQTRGTTLGFAWWILNPLLMLGLYTVVFGMVMGGHFPENNQNNPYNYPLGIFIGLALLGLVNECFGQSTFAIISKPNLVEKVVFPTELLSMAQAGSSILRMAINLVLAVIGIVIIGPGLTWESLYLPILLLPLIMIAVGFGWAGSAIGVYFRDSQHIVSFLTSLLFYASGVFYSASKVPEPVMHYLRFNPMIHAVAEARKVMLWHTPPDWHIIAYLYLCGLGVFVGGLYIFQRLKGGFADVI